MRTLRDTTIERVRELRIQRGMTQQELADRLNEVGASVDRTAVAKIETGSRELSLLEAFQCALALEVAPVHLFVPTDSDEPIQVRPDRDASPDETRAWIRGHLPISQDPRVYFAMVPEAEFHALAGLREDRYDRYPAAGTGPYGV